MAGGWEVRPATLSDRATVVEMGAMLAAEAPEAEGAEFNREGFREAVTGCMSQGLCLVLELDTGLLAGFAQGIAFEHPYLTRWEAQDLGVFIRPEWRRELPGAFQELVDSLRVRMRLIGAERLYFGVASGRRVRGLGRLYRRMGLQPMDPIYREVVAPAEGRS